MPKHEITKARHETVRRQLHLLEKQQLTPNMLRLTFKSDQLAGFHSPSADDHIKIFLPARNGNDQIKRDYTPRAWDLAAGTLTLEFALHQAGPASDWARHASIGDTLEIGGPRGSSVVPDDFDWYLLIGDATALPSFARRLESLRTGVPVSMFALIASPEDQQSLATAAHADLHWLPAGPDSEADLRTLTQALGRWVTPPGDGYIWIAAEAAVSQQLYTTLTEQRNHPKEWIKAAAYWKRGESEG